MRNKHAPFINEPINPLPLLQTKQDTNEPLGQLSAEERASREAKAQAVLQAWTESTRAALDSGNGAGGGAAASSSSSSWSAAGGGGGSSLGVGGSYGGAGGATMTTTTTITSSSWRVRSGVDRTMSTFQMKI